MRCNPWRWLWGLPLLAMWVWISGLLEKERIETDLRDRSQMALTAAGFDWAEPGYGYRDGLINGTAPSSERASEALDVARGVWGVRVVEGDFNRLQTLSDFTWSAERSAAGALIFSGYVPDDDSRQAILDAARQRFEGVRIIDNLSLAAGAPPTEVWLSGVRFGLSQLAQLSTGTLSIKNTGLALVGVAASSEAYKGVKGALRSRLPNGFSLAQDGVTPPMVAPYAWTAQKSDTQLVLSGYAPSVQARKALFDEAKVRFPDLAIIDRMEIGGGAPSGFLRVGKITLQQLARLNTGTATLDGTTVMLAGEASDQLIGEAIDTDYKAAMLDGFAAPTDITFATVIPPRVSPYKTGLDVTTDLVRLTGYVPSEDSRDALLTAIKAAFPNRRIDDQLELGSGEPEGWRSCLDAGVLGLTKIGGGIINMEDRLLELRGKSDDEVLAEGLTGDVRAAANRACKTDVKVVLDIPPEPDLTWRARLDEADGLILEGDVPDAETRAMLVASASKLFPKIQVLDRMRVAGGYAKKWRTIAETGLSSLAKLRSGEAVITGQELLVRGEAKDTAVAGAVKDQLAHTLAKGYRGRDIITVRSDAMIWAETEARRKALEKAEAEQKAAEVEAERLRKEEDARARAEEDARREAEAKAAEERARAEADAQARAEKAKADEAARVAALQAEADACGDLLSSANSEGSIQFRFGSSTLDSRSNKTLDRLVEIANECPKFRIEIEGHTDAEGRPETNLALSQRRAQAVVDYLVAAGIPLERLKAVGYGETRPVASNDSAANRAKNRRIEFVVKVD